MAEAEVSEAGIRWPLDATTAALFGAYLANERSQMSLSLDGLAQGTFRSEAWFGAIERGEIQLTDETLKEVVSAFVRRKKKLKLHETVQGLQREPFGAAANDQRARIHLSGWVADPRRSDELPESTIAEEAIPPHDRLLVTGPVAFLIAVLILVAQMLSWNWSETQPPSVASDQTSASSAASIASTAPPATDPTPLPAGSGDSLETLISLVGEVLIPAAAVLGLGAVLTLRTTETLLCGYANKCRSKSRSVDLVAVSTMLKTDGIPAPTVKNWKVSHLLAYIHPVSREAVRKAANRAAFTERVEPAIALGIQTS